MSRATSSRILPLTRSLKRLGRSVGRRNRGLIARQAINDSRIRVRIVDLLGKRMAKEMKAMCAMKTDSILRKRSRGILRKLNVQTIVSEMEMHAPHTLAILRGCLAGRKRSKAKNERRIGRTKTRIIEVDRVVAVACAILLRGRSQRMNLLQHIASLILYCGHASKRVSIQQIYTLSTKYANMDSTLHYVFF